MKGEAINKYSNHVARTMDRRKDLFVRTLFVSRIKDIRIQKDIFTAF